MCTLEQAVVSCAQSGWWRDLSKMRIYYENIWEYMRIHENMRFTWNDNRSPSYVGRLEMSAPRLMNASLKSPSDHKERCPEQSECGLPQIELLLGFNTPAVQWCSDAVSIWSVWTKCASHRGRWSHGSLLYNWYNSRRVTLWVSWLESLWLAYKSNPGKPEGL